MSYKLGVKTSKTEQNFGFNNVVFATEQECIDYSLELTSRWFAVVETKVFETTDKPNYVFDNESWRAKPISK